MISTQVLYIPRIRAFITRDRSPMSSLDIPTIFAKSKHASRFPLPQHHTSYYISPVQTRDHRIHPHWRFQPRLAESPMSMLRTLGRFRTKRRRRGEDDDDVGVRLCVCETWIPLTVQKCHFYAPSPLSLSHEYQSSILGEYL